MQHELHRVTSFAIIGDTSLRVVFDDGSEQEIEFSPVLHGEIYGPLADPAFFAQVRLDEEVHTLVWPNGADFDPATLHNWPSVAAAMAELAESWVAVPS